MSFPRTRESSMVISEKLVLLTSNGIKAKIRIADSEGKGKVISWQNGMEFMLRARHASPLRL